MKDRTDTAFIRHLEKALNKEAAAIYDTLPFLTCRLGPDDYLTMEDDILGNLPGTLRTPFDDFLLALPFGVKPVMDILSTQYGPVPDRGRLWIRVRQLSKMTHDPATLIKADHLRGISKPGNWLLLEGWAQKTILGQHAATPDHSLVPTAKEDLLQFANYWHLYPNRCRRPIFGQWCNIKGCTMQQATMAMCSFSEVLHSTMCRFAILCIGHALEHPAEGLRQPPEQEPTRKAEEGCTICNTHRHPGTAKG